MNDNEDTQVETQEEVQTEEKSDKLSNREALEQAIIEKREVREEPAEKTRQEESTPTKTEVRAAVEADLDPPSEFSGKGRDAWAKKDIRGIQEEYQRINKSRLQELDRERSARTKAEQEGKSWRDLGNMAAPYIEARGAEGVTPQQAMMEALALVNELKKADPATTKAELKKLGIDLDAAPGTTAKTNSEDLALQEKVNRLLAKEEEREFQATVHTFQTVFDNLTSLKTRTGDVVFPDLLDNSEEGKQFAKELGSLTKDENFQKGVLRRFPDADFAVVVREAYKYLGGKVSGEPVTVSTSNNQKHIEKSRRAAASAPQGSTIKSRNDSSSLIGKLDKRAALARAIAEQQEH